MPYHLSEISGLENVFQESYVDKVRFVDKKTSV